MQMKADWQIPNVNLQSWVGHPVPKVNLQVFVSHPGPMVRQGGAVVTVMEMEPAAPSTSPVEGGVRVRRVSRFKLSFLGMFYPKKGMVRGKVRS